MMKNMVLFLSDLYAVFAPPQDVLHHRWRQVAEADYLQANGVIG